MRHEEDGGKGFSIAISLFLSRWLCSSLARRKVWEGRKAEAATKDGRGSNETAPSNI
jgi:hypothetical protein